MSYPPEGLDPFGSAMAMIPATALQLAPPPGNSTQVQQSKYLFPYTIAVLLCLTAFICVRCMYMYVCVSLALCVCMYVCLFLVPIPASMLVGKVRETPSGLLPNAMHVLYGEVVAVQQQQECNRKGHRGT